MLKSYDAKTFLLIIPCALLFILSFITPVSLHAGAGGNGPIAHCGKYSTVSKCPFIQVDPTKVIGDFSAGGGIENQELFDWYSDIETFEHYIRWIPWEGGRYAARLWASGILGAIEYNYYGPFSHDGACTIVLNNPTDAYSYVYQNVC